jgi:hypothetical protein
MDKIVKIEMKVDYGDAAIEDIEQVLRDELNAEFTTEDDDGEECWITMSVRSIVIAAE